MLKFFIVFAMRFCINFGIPLGVRSLDFAIVSMRKVVFKVRPSRKMEKRFDEYITKIGPKMETNP